jgi:hypothetical protein
MGPELIAFIKSGVFNAAVWEASLAETADKGFDQVLVAIERQTRKYAELIGEFSEADFHGEIEMFHRRASRGSLLVNIVLCGCAAYRAQLFLYLKATGNEELSTMNLWLGVDAPKPG